MGKKQKVRMALKWMIIIHLLSKQVILPVELEEEAELVAQVAVMGVSLMAQLQVEAIRMIIMGWKLEPKILNLYKGILK